MTESVPPAANGREADNMALEYPPAPVPETIEGRCFQAAIDLLEGHFHDRPSMGPLTSAKVVGILTRTAEKTSAVKEVRETLSRNCSHWFSLARVFMAAIPSLTERSATKTPLKKTSGTKEPDWKPDFVTQASTALMVKNHQSLKDDLQVMHKLVTIARNMLVTADPEVPQDLCTASYFDQMLQELLVLCINITRGGYEPEIQQDDDVSRSKLKEVIDSYRQVLVGCLQHIHNWINKNDRNKMEFWMDAFFDESRNYRDTPIMRGHDYRFRPNAARTEIHNWLGRTAGMCETARQLLDDFSRFPPQADPGDESDPAASRSSEGETGSNPSKSLGQLVPELEGFSSPAPEVAVNEAKAEQDRAYGRVSREIDTWWLNARDVNYEEWSMDMPSAQAAQKAAGKFKALLLQKNPQSFPRQGHDNDDLPNEKSPIRVAAVGSSGHEAFDAIPYVGEDDDVDDVSYVESTLTTLPPGIFADLPRILDTKQIEALHMIVRSCILDSSGSGLTEEGENLQKTRCRILLAMDSGRVLLREMLIFLAVWDQDETTLVFQITAQIVESIHHNALIPYAWTILSVPKDIVSASQTILLRLIDHIFRARNINPPAVDSKEHLRDVKMIYYLFYCFRSVVLPDCLALLTMQSEVRDKHHDPADFPVDIWAMDKAKDGLSQFLELWTTVSETPGLRKYLIQWEVVYELIALLKGLEAAVEKKNMVGPPSKASFAKPPTSGRSATFMDGTGADGLPPPPPAPSPHDPAYKFPWAGVKGQILTLLAGLLQPPPGQRSPGNPDVQAQIMKYNGIVSLLNCCLYDDHNRYARERTQICLKWLMDGSEAANKFLRNLSVINRPGNPLTAPSTPAGGNSAPATPTAMTPTAVTPTAVTPTATVRFDGIGGEFKVQVRAAAAPTPSGSGGAKGGAGAGAATATAGGNASGSSRQQQSGISHLPVAQQQQQAVAAAGSFAVQLMRDKNLLRDIVTLADQAARLALGGQTSGGDTGEVEAEDFMKFCDTFNNKLAEWEDRHGVALTEFQEFQGIDGRPSLADLVRCAQRSKSMTRDGVNQGEFRSYTEAFGGKGRGT